MVFTNPARDEATARARSDLIQRADNLLNRGWAESTRITYESRLSLFVHGEEQRIDDDLLPINSPDRFMVVFACMQGMHWSAIRQNKAAIRAWHIANNQSDAFDRCWNSKTALFWAGLKKSARQHESHAKRAVSFTVLAAFCAHRRSANTAAGRRDCAMAVFLFFGVRRANADISLPRAGVTHTGDALRCFIATQKNDPEGRGLECFIPDMPDAPLNPATVIWDWCSEWDAIYGAQPANAPLFSTTGKDVPGRLSYDNWRKTVTKFFKNQQVATHSFRKGGSRWWLFEAQANEAGVQGQGG